MAVRKRILKFQFIEEFAVLIKVDTKCPTIEKICPLFADGDWIESKDQSDDGNQFIQVENVGNGVYIEKGVHARFMDESIFERVHCAELLPNDILISRPPDSVGRACTIPEGLGKAMTAVDCTIVCLNPKVPPEFFVVCALTPLYASQIETAVTGSARKRISRKNLRQVYSFGPKFRASEAVCALLQESDKSKFAFLKCANQNNAFRRLKSKNKER